MNKQEYIHKVSELLGTWIAKIRLNTALDFYDINKVAEDLSCNLLNVIYDLELYNLNKDKPNHPAIDLGDKTNKIAFQITSRTDAKKFHENIKTFETDYYGTYLNGIRFLVLNAEEIKFGNYKYPSLFNKKDHVLTDKTLIQKISEIYDSEDFIKTDKILALLEHEIGIKETITKNYFFLNKEQTVFFTQFGIDKIEKLTNSIIPVILILNFQI